MHVEPVIAYFGSRAATARALETSYQNVKQWVDSGRIPKGRQYEIQVKSRGLLVAEDWDPRKEYREVCPRRIVG